MMTKNDDTHFWVNYLFKSSSSRVKHPEQRKPCSLFLLLSSLSLSLSLSLSSAHTQIAMKSTTQCNSCGLRGSHHMFFIEERILASTPNLQQWEDGITYINSILHRFWSGECSICTMKDTEDKVICWNLTLVCRAVMSIRSRGPLNWSVCVISLAWGRHNRQRSPSSPR